jgi:uncharacterized membrane protein YhhN
MEIWLLSLGILISAILAIWFAYRQPDGWFYLFKPLTTILIILVPILGSEGLSLFKGLILAGLLCSLAGDVFLMLPADRFLVGLVAFLVAHLFYISGFLIDQGTPIYWPILPVFVFAGLIGWVLKDGLGEMKIPTFAYIAVISTMVWLAWSRWISEGQTEHLLAFCGAGLFMVSDAILALDRFKGKFKPSRAINLFCYYAGQWLIALSLVSLDRLGM